MDTNTVKQHRSSKRASEKCVRRNISLPPELDRQADLVASKYAFASFSDYVQARIRKDLGLDLAA